jgi:hypothetical protein
MALATDAHAKAEVAFFANKVMLKEGMKNNESLGIR